MIVTICVYKYVCCAVTLATIDFIMKPSKIVCNYVCLMYIWYCSQSILDCVLTGKYPPRHVFSSLDMDWLNLYGYEAMMSHSLVHNILVAYLYTYNLVRC